MRNTNPNYLKKLSQINVNGFKIDIKNYIYNPSYNFDYPQLTKKISETDKDNEYISFSYFKFYDGNGEYSVERYSVPKNEEWAIMTTISKTIIKNSRRFSLTELIKLAEEEYKYIKPV